MLWSIINFIFFYFPLLTPFHYFSLCVFSVKLVYQLMLAIKVHGLIKSWLATITFTMLQFPKVPSTYWYSLSYHFLTTLTYFKKKEEKKGERKKWKIIMVEKWRVLWRNISLNSMKSCEKKALVLTIFFFLLSLHNALNAECTRKRCLYFFLL